MRLLWLKISDLTYDVMLFSIGSRFPNWNMKISIPLGKGKQSRMAFLLLLFLGASYETINISPLYRLYWD